MTVSRTDLAALLAPHQGTELAKRFMRDIEPSCRAAEDGMLPMAEAEQLNVENVGNAIAAAAREEVSGLLTLSLSGETLSKNIRAEGDYDTFLTLSMRRNRRDEFTAAYGEEALARLVAPLWWHLCSDLTEATRRTCAELFDSVEEALAHDVAHASSVAVAYGAAYVSQNDAKRYAEVRGLLKLLPWIVPIGSPSNSGGLWLVATK